MVDRINEWDRDRYRYRENDERFRYASDWPTGRGSDYGARPEDFTRYGRRFSPGPWNMEEYYQQRDPSGIEGWGEEYMGQADFGWAGDYGYERAGSWGIDTREMSRPGRYGERPYERGYSGQEEPALGQRDWRREIGRPWRYDTESWMVPGPFTGQGPASYQRSAERIREDVCQRLTRHGQVDARNIQVEVDENTGEVTLNGTVESRRAKRMAEDTAESVTGVPDIHNRLRIEPQQEGEQAQSPQGKSTRKQKS